MRKSVKSEIHGFIYKASKSDIKKDKREKKEVFIWIYGTLFSFSYTWHVLPQYQTAWQDEHLLRLLDVKHQSHLEHPEVLLGTET